MKRKIITSIVQQVQQWQSEYDLSDFHESQIEIMRPTSTQYGDWTTNIAFHLAKYLRKSPSDIAQNIAQNISISLSQYNIKIRAVDGYVNFLYAPSIHQEELRNILKHGAQYGMVDDGNGEDVILEYVSANPTGPLTLGNARGGPYGDTLANVLDKSGYAVTREYYVNDFGNQIVILGHSVIGDNLAQYKGEYIDKLHKKIIDNVQDDVVDARMIGIQSAQYILRNIIIPSLASANISFDNFFSESELHKSSAIDEVIKKLTQMNLVYREDGALFFQATKFGDEKDRVLITADGRKTYFCADIAYHLDKLSRADRLINIWGADHGGTVARLKGALQALGHENKLDIILVQFVRVIENGKEVKMSKRRGTYITLSDLIEDVGVDVTRFIFLMQSASSHVTFDLKLAREQSDKNPVYYVQYAHARMASILRKATSENITFADADLSLLIHQKEIDLIRVLSEFPDIIQRTANDYQVHRLPHYAIHIADCLHSFYGACKVVDSENKKLSQARTALIQATKTILTEVLRTVGVSAPDKM